MVMNPNITGIIHCIIRFICICLGSVDGFAIIFCCTHIEPPTSNGSITLVGSGSERSNHRKPLFSGTAVCTPGSHEYSFCERSTSRSGFCGSAWMIDWYSPIQIGSCTTIGPRHPTGFTPSSLYSLIVSCVTFCESFPYFCRISWIFGCNRDIARLALICFRVSGYIAILTTMVNAMMLNPKLLANIPYRNISAFSMGPRSSASQMSMIMPMPGLSPFY